MNALRAPGSLALLGLTLVLCSLPVSSQPALRYRRVLQPARPAATATQEDETEQMMEALWSQVVQRRAVSQSSKVSSAQWPGTPDVTLPAGRGVAKESKVTQLPAGNRSVAKVIQAPPGNKSVAKLGKTSIVSMGAAQESKTVPSDNGVAQEGEFEVPELRVTVAPKIEVPGVGVVQESGTSAVGAAREIGVPGVGVVIVPEIRVSGVGVLPEVEVPRVDVDEEGEGPGVGGAPEVEVFVVGGASGDRGEDVKTELDHTPNGTSTLPPRERKAGCKSFYWKSFTSC